MSSNKGRTCLTCSSIVKTSESRTSAHCLTISWALEGASCPQARRFMSWLLSNTRYLRTRRTSRAIQTCRVRAWISLANQIIRTTLQQAALASNLQIHSKKVPISSPLGSITINISRICRGSLPNISRRQELARSCQEACRCPTRMAAFLARLNFTAGKALWCSNHQSIKNSKTTVSETRS